MRNVSSNVFNISVQFFPLWLPWCRRALRNDTASANIFLHFRNDMLTYVWVLCVCVSDVGWTPALEIYISHVPMHRRQSCTYFVISNKALRRRWASNLPPSPKYSVCWNQFAFHVSLVRIARTHSLMQLSHHFCFRVQIEINGVCAFGARVRDVRNFYHAFI